MHAGNEVTPSLGPSLINDYQSIPFYTFELDLLFLSGKKKKVNSYSFSGLTDLMFLGTNPWIKKREEEMVGQKGIKFANYHRASVHTEYGNPAIIMHMRVN